jgi:hypothetical protein
MPKPSTPPPAPAKRRSRGTKAPGEKAPAREPKAREPKAAAAATAPEPKPAREPRASRDRQRAPRPQQPLNDQLPFIEFIAEHLPGSKVEGEVVEFSSHGAYVQVGAVRCYIPLKNMGTPAPRSARDVLERGQRREFVVQSIEAARRGIDLALPGFESIAAPSSTPDDAPARPRRSRAKSADKALPVAASTDAAPAVDKAPTAVGAKQPESEATLAATKKAAGRKTAAKKTAARKSTAKKATAKKAPARKKAAAKKAPAKRKAAAKKAPAKRKAAGARKAAKKR